MSQSFNVPHSLSVMMTLLLGVLVTFLMTKTIYNLVMAVYKARFRRGASHLSKTTDAASFMIEKLRFMIFVKFFSNCLTVSFLSQYILHLAQLAGAKANLASLAYVIYTLIFALMIVPGGYLVEVKNVKLTLVVMLALEAVVFFVLGVTHCFWLIFIIQALFGMIIPVSSSAEYAYLFVFSSEQNRSHTLALYNNTVKGAMISGVFLGGLILPYLHEQGVFLLACTLVLFCAVYAGLFIPKIDIDEKKRQTLSRRFLKKAHFKEVFKHIPIIINLLGFENFPSL